MGQVYMVRETFEEWKLRIERIVSREFEMTIYLDELPDQPYRIWYDTKIYTPEDVAGLIIDDLNDLYETGYEVQTEENAIQSN